MIAPPRSPSGRSSSRTIELRDLGRTGLRPTRRHTSQMLVGYAIPSAVTPGNDGNHAGAGGPVNSNNLSPPQSGQVAISAPIMEESSTAPPPAEQQYPPSAYDPQQPFSILNTAAPSVAEGMWAKVSAIATLYQAFLATIQTAGGIAFGAATVVLAVKGLQLMQLEYCEDHKVGPTAPSVLNYMLTESRVTTPRHSASCSCVLVWSRLQSSGGVLAGWKPFGEVPLPGSSRG